MLSAAQYEWRPGDGVRSVGELLLHVAADNYYLATPLGTPAPDATGIKAGDYPSVQAYENQKLDRDAIIAQTRASFEHLKKSLAAVPRIADG